MVSESGHAFHFPGDFVWGCATASYQIEGAVDEGGRGESIWDRFCARPGNVRNGESGAIADDHFHRFRQDIAVMRDLGLTGYRFSVAWPRIFPEGNGTVNEQGFAFYEDLIDELLRAGIQPYVTLYHWDLPQALEDRGGWLYRDTAGAFAEYTQAVVGRLGDRVTHWITHNEPQVAAFAGYAWGDHAPGHRGGPQAGLRAAHHLLLSHGMAFDAIKSVRPQAAVGITLNLTVVEPATESEADNVAASRQDARRNRLFLDPVFGRGYAPETVAAFDGVEPPVQDGDLETIAGPVDFLGINYYSRSVVTATPNGRAKQVRPEGSSYTEMDWEVYPAGLRTLLLRVQNDYAPPRIYVTENGAAFSDVRLHDGSVRDPERLQYVRDHIAAVGSAIEEGAAVHGYFLWSLLDNFEWAHGYSKRFGIVFVDYPTQERVVKSSGHWYGQFVRQQTGRR